jgi:hypothetical protein
VSVSTARPFPLEAIAGPAERAELPAAGDALSGREATLRAAATLCLAGIALMQAIELPSLLAQGGWPAVLWIGVIALCVAVCLALVAAPGGVSRPVWRVVAATATLVLAGWAAPRAFALTGPADVVGDWAALPGSACAAAAAVCLGLAAAAVGPGRATARGLATAVAVLIAIAPSAGALLVAVGPGPDGGEAALAADVHVHAHLNAAEPDIRFRPGAKGNHYLTPVPRPPHTPAIGVALVVVATLALVAGGVGHLRWRSVPAPAPARAAAPRARRRA